MADATLATPEKVAAIDFGTGFCSLAYTLKKDDEIAHIPLSSADSDTARVPTAILLKRTNPDDTFTVAKFGIHAQGEATQLNSKQLKDYLYFEFFKMNLFHKAVSPLFCMQYTSVGGATVAYYFIPVCFLDACVQRRIPGTVEPFNHQ